MNPTPVSHSAAPSQGAPTAGRAAQRSAGAHAAASNGGGGEVGFLALLGATELSGDVDASVLPEMTAGGEGPLLGGDSGESATNANSAVVADAGALLAWQGLLVAPTGVPLTHTPSGVAAQAVSTVGLTSDALQSVGGSALGAAVSAAASHNGWAPDLPVRSDFVAQTAAMDVGADAVESALNGSATMSGGVRRHSGAKGLPGAAVDTVLGGGKTGLGAMLESSRAGGDATTHGALSLPAAMAESALEPLSVKVAEKSPEGRVSESALSVMASVTAESRASADTGRHSDTASSREEAAPSAVEATAADAWGLVESGGEMTGVATDGANAVFESGPTEEVAFWTRNQIHNAEITVSHDGMPVEVSVSMQGREAHVAFRSDQENARAWLGDSAAQLDSLMQQQGLTLSSMSVGTSAQGQSGQQREAADGRDPSRKEGVAEVAVPGPAGGGTLAANGRRVLDVFA